MIPDILEDEKKLESFTKYMERDRTRFGRFLNAVHELMERVRTFFEGLGFKARTPEEDLIRDAYIEMRRAYNRSAAEYREQKRNGTVAGTVLVDKFGGIRRENGERKNGEPRFSIHSMGKDSDGQELYRVYVSEDITRGENPVDTPSKIKRYILDNFDEVWNEIPGSAKFSTKIDKTGASEFAYSEYTKGLKGKERYDKWRMAANLDEIIQARRNVEVDARKYHHSKNSDNYITFSRADVEIQVKNNLYSVRLVTGITSEGKEYFYDVVDLKRIDTGKQKSSRPQPSLDNKVIFKRETGWQSATVDSISETAEKNNKQNVNNQKTIVNEDKHSTVDTTKITPGMSDEERAEVLNNSSIRLAEYVGNGEISPAKVYNLKTTYGKQARKILLTLGEKFGIFDRQYYNKAVELTFNYSKSSLKESFNKQSRINKTVEDLTGFEDFAKMLSVFDDVVNNAVPIEVHEDKYKGTQRETRELKHDYVLLSAFKDGDFIIPVELHIKEFDNNDGNRLYVNVTLGKVKIEEGEISTTPPAVQNERQTRIIPSPSTISVPQLIGELNNNLGNFFKYLPPSMLSEAQNVSRSTAVDDENYRLSVMRGEDVSETLKKKAVNTAMLHKLYTPITYNGKEYLAVTTVEEFYDEGRKGVFRRAYNLNNIEISPVAVPQFFNPADTTSDSGGKLHAVSISDLFGLVKTFDKEFRYNSVNPAFLNEDGTPKVVYHGTDAEFWTFSFENRGKNSEMLGVGYYFTDKKNECRKIRKPCD